MKRFFPILAFMYCGQLVGQTQYIWKGTVDNNMNNPANWLTPPGQPSSGNALLFDINPINASPIMNIPNSSAPYNYILSSLQIDSTGPSYTLTAAGGGSTFTVPKGGATITLEYISPDFTTIDGIALLLEGQLTIQNTNVGIPPVFNVITGNISTSDASSSGGLTIQGDGGLILTPSVNNSYSGPTIVAGSILQAGNASAFSESSAVTLTGGTLDLHGFTNPVASLQGDSSSLVTLGGATLVIINGNGQSFSGGITSTGFGGIIIQGGTLQLTGSNQTVYSGTTVVQNGGKLIAGASNALSTAPSNTTISGGTLVIAKGENSVGTLTNTGTVTLFSKLNATTVTNSGTLSVNSELNATTYTQSGLLQIGVVDLANLGQIVTSGTATLGGSLVVQALPGFSMTEGQTADLIIATGGLVGTYPAADVSLIFPSTVIPSISYVEGTPGIVQLSFAKTVPAHLNASTNLVLASVNEHNFLLMRQCLHMRDRMPMERRMNTHYAVSHSQVVASNDEVVQFTTPQIRREQERLAAKARKATPYNPWSVYAGPIASYGNVKTRGDQIGVGYHSIGALGGCDYVIPDRGDRSFYAGIGAALDYRVKLAKAEDHWGSFRIEKIHGTLYSTFVPKSVPELAIDAMAGYAYAWDDIHRKAGYTLEDTATGHPHESIFDLLFDIEYKFSKERYCSMPKNLAFIPLLDLQYICNWVSSYTEHGAGIFDVHVNSRTPQSLSSLLGARLNYLFETSCVNVFIEVDGGWQREYLNHNQKVTFTAFNTGGTPASVTAYAPGRNTWLLGVDMLTSFSDVVQVEASADFKWNSLVFDAFFYLGLRKEF